MPLEMGERAGECECRAGECERVAGYRVDDSRAGDVFGLGGKDSIVYSHPQLGMSLKSRTARAVPAKGSKTLSTKIGG